MKLRFVDNFTRVDRSPEVKNVVNEDPQVVLLSFREAQSYHLDLTATYHMHLQIPGTATPNQSSQLSNCSPKLKKIIVVEIPIKVKDHDLLDCFEVLTHERISIFDKVCPSYRRNT